jgi:ABC-type glycerol-3-phosphate transport system permease component
MATKATMLEKLGASPRVFWTKKRKEYARKTLAVLLLSAGSVAMLFPLVWMLSTSLKPDAQLFRWPPIWIPSPIKWDNYARAWRAAPFTRYTFNTLSITLISMAGVVLTSSLCAFGFARLRAPGRDLLFSLVLATMMLPHIVTMIPLFILFARLHWIDTWLPLIVPAYFGNPFYIFLLRQFFRSIPAELQDAARIDGCSSLRIWRSIFLPLSQPALATVAIFHFMGSWNDFLGPLIYLTTDSKKTLALGLTVFLGAHGSEWSLLMATSVLVTLPMIVMFFMAQRFFIQGIVTSGLAGR